MTLTTLLQKDRDALTEWDSKGYQPSFADEDLRLGGTFIEQM